MRADRLLALLMLLQTRGKLTAKNLAELLEVSERTIYRDLQALSMAGVPVYADSGPGGGCMLLERYRTDLTGLNEEELRALFMVGIPAPLVRLGVGQALQSALLKLAIAVPETRAKAEERVRQRIYLDSSPQAGLEEPQPCLDILYRAVWEDACLELTYLLRFEPGRETPFNCPVEPYGLVARAGVWYLVAARAGQMQVYRISQVQAARPTGAHFERHAGFELSEFWQNWCDELVQQQSSYPVTLRISPELLPELARRYGSERIPQAERDGARFAIVTLPFEGLVEARSRLLGYGRAVEVLQPEALRLSLSDFARQIATLYDRKE